jgi:DNA primase
MPGIDFRELRSRIGITDVLRLCDFHEVEAVRDQVRGPCPIHGPSSSSSRSFSANLRKNNFRCFKCGASGNQLDLWVAVTKLPLHEAARDLCAKLDIEVPEIGGA